MITSTKTIIEKYWKAINDRDWKSFEQLVAGDIIYILPQSREKIRGRLAFKEFNETYPGNWTLSVTTLVTDEKRAVSKIAFVNDNEEQTGISFFELQNNVIQKITEYWPTPYEPPLRNCDYIERY